MSALERLPDYIREQITDPNHPKRRGMREDLLIIPEAEAAGWTVKFRNDHWHNCAQFERGEVHVWIAKPPGSSLVLKWRRANVRDDRFQDHEWLDSLREALGLAEQGAAT